MSIAWKVAERAHEEGANFVLTNAPIAMRMGEINNLAEKTNSEIIPADATSVEDLTNLFNQSQEILGGKIDFVLHSIGMSPNVRKKKHYTGLNYEWYKQTLDVSAMSLHKTLQVAKDLDAINEWGSVVALTYIAAQRIFPDYNDMADAKSLLESITRSFGYHYGTLIQTVNNFFKKKRDVLFDIDWQGFQQLKQSGMDVVGIFILPPNKKELIRRLKNRGRDTSEEMKKRMSLAQDEISHFPEYDYVVVNNDLDVCVSKIQNIILAERLKKSNQYNLTEFVNKFRD